MRARTFLSTLCSLLALLLCAPAVAQSSGAMAVSVTVVNTCSFGRVNSCALPGTRLVAAPVASASIAADPTAAMPRQVVHL